MSSELDFELDGFEPLDALSEHAQSSICARDLTVLTEHHSRPNGSHSYLVAHDGAATWRVPGSPQLLAVKIARDFNARTFSFESSAHATVAFAQGWLVERGCPPGPIAKVGDGFMTAADDLTVQVEEQIRSSSARYEVLDTESWDCDPCETWTLVRDSRALELPVRVFLEEGDTEAHTYTVREGAFPDRGAAQAWLDTRDGPLPEPPEFRGDASALRTSAALARSSGIRAAAKAGLPAVSAPAASRTPMETPRRSL